MSLPLSTPAVLLNQISEDPRDPNHLIATLDSTEAAALNTFFISHDAGLTWAPVTISQPAYVAWNGAILFSTTGATVYTQSGLVSNDGGNTWSILLPNISSLSIGAKGRLYALEVSDDEGHTSVLSSDDGKTWSSVGVEFEASVAHSVTLSAAATANPVHVPPPQFIGLTADPQIAGRLYLGVIEMNTFHQYTSQDEGTSWATFGSQGGNDTSRFDVARCSLGATTVLYARSTTHVDASFDNGATWVKADWGVNSSYGSPIICSPQDPHHVFVQAWNPQVSLESRTGGQ